MTFGFPPFSVDIITPCTCTRNKDLVFLSVVCYLHKIPDKKIQASKWSLSTIKFSDAAKTVLCLLLNSRHSLQIVRGSVQSDLSGGFSSSMNDPLLQWKCIWYSISNFTLLWAVVKITWVVVKESQVVVGADHHQPVWTEPRIMWLWPATPIDNPHVLILLSVLVCVLYR